MSNRRGSVLAEAADVINGERMDVYGNPEDSFSLIAEMWNLYIQQKWVRSQPMTLVPSDVAMMMALFKLAREMHQHKRDNIRDAAGYLGIYADMQSNTAIDHDDQVFTWQRARLAETEKMDIQRNFTPRR